MRKARHGRTTGGVLLTRQMLEVYLDFMLAKVHFEILQRL